MRGIRIRWEGRGVKRRAKRRAEAQMFFWGSGSPGIPIKTDEELPPEAPRP